jgi:ketopantoate reductase
MNRKIVAFALILVVGFVSYQFLVAPKIKDYLATKSAVNRVIGECTVLLAMNIPKASYETLQNVCICIMEERKEFCGAEEMCYRTDIFFNHRCFSDNASLVW